MTTTITPFDYQGHAVRTLTGPDGEPRFVLADLCKVLNIGNPSDVSRRLSETMKGVDQIDTPGGRQKVTVVTEAGMYSVVLRSDKPEAVQFQEWVTTEVLPSIRKHGVYMTPDTLEKVLTDPDLLIRLATDLKNERAARAELEAKVAEDAPMTRFGRTLAASDGDLLVKQVAAAITAEGVRISQPTLFTWLRDHGWLCRNRGRLWNAPTQWALDKGFLRASVTLIATNHGSEEKTTPKITAAGQADLIDGFLTGRYTITQGAAA